MHLIFYLLELYFKDSLGLSFAKKYAVEVSHDKAELYRRISYQKVCNQRFTYCRAEFYSRFGLFFTKKYAVEVSNTRAKFHIHFGLFLPKMMQLKFHTLKLNFTFYLGL